MRLKIVLIGAMLVLLLFAGCQFPSGGVLPEGGRQWTVMVYMAADNDLAGEAWKDLNSMELAGSSDAVALVVELDTPSGAWRYYVTKDTDPNGITSPVLESLGNADSGSSETLLEFIRFTRERYPAKHYTLILWNHGSGVKGTSKDIAFDFTTRRAITLPELRLSLASSGVHFDLLGMDACFMQMVEVAYEVRNSARILVSSQENIPGEGWDYETVLRALVQNPTIDAERLAQLIVESYIAYYQRIGMSGKYTLSAVDLSRVEELVQAIDALAATMLGDSRTPPRVYVALGDSAFYFGDPDFVDLGDFMEFLAFDPRVSFEVREKAAVVLDKLGECVLISGNASVISSGVRASGLSIYFPYTVYMRKYGMLEFASATYWDELVQYLIQWR